MGYKKEEFYSPEFDFLSLIAPESVETVRSSFKRHNAGQEVAPYKYSLINKKSQRLEVIITTKLINFEGDPAILGIVTDIIKHGKTSKEIAAMLHVSAKAVAFHRGNIRNKLGLTNKKINLQTYLQSFPQ